MFSKSRFLPRGLDTRPLAGGGGGNVVCYYKPAASPPRSSLCRVRKKITLYDFVIPTRRCFGAYPAGEGSFRMNAAPFPGPRLSALMRALWIRAICSTR